MAKVKIVTLDSTRPLPSVAGSANGVESYTYLDGKEPLHLRRHDLAPKSTFDVAGIPNDLLVYVVSGSIEADGCTLIKGSSAIVEYGAKLTLGGGAAGAIFLAFNKATRRADSRPGGHIHILPRDGVPVTDDLGTQNEMGGGLHADAACPTCTVWLHENDFHCRTGTPVPVHSHSEDEIIFVTAGEIKLGNRYYGPSTALAVAADTKYGFEAGPGLSFINFRAASPTVTTPHSTHDEAAMWITRLGRPAYLQPSSAHERVHS